MRSCKSCQGTVFIAHRQKLKSCVGVCEWMCLLANIMNQLTDFNEILGKQPLEVQLQLIDFLMVTSANQPIQT